MPALVEIGSECPQVDFTLGLPLGFNLFALHRFLLFSRFGSEGSQLLKFRNSTPPQFRFSNRLLFALRRDLNFDWSNVQIRIQHGTATFSGSLANHRQIDHMLAIALMVEGVRDVRSELKISR